MKIKIAVISFFLLFGAIACQNTNSSKTGKVDLKTKKDSLSYAVGMQIGRNLVREKVDVDFDLLIKALNDGYSDTSWALTKKQARSIIFAYQRSQYDAKKVARKKLGMDNMITGKEFLGVNKSKKGVHTTKSGLEYKILRKGKGASPKDGAEVTVNYKGTLLNGKEFDSSYKRGKPAVFSINRVIKGWTEVLKLMKPGSKWKVWIPPELAYGFNGSGQAIGPNETLVFEIELLKFKNKK